MSVAEITSAIDRLTPEERAEVEMYLRRRFCEDTPERRRELSEIADEMDAGQKFSLSDLKKIHEERLAKGK